MITKAVVEEIINAWDPIDLFSGAPKDEYQHETLYIASLLEDTIDVSEIAHGIQDIFTKNFGEDIFRKNYDECLDIANTILKRSLSMNCDTRYPIMLIHGTGFRDRKYLNYWGRIPAALEERGATLFYGNQDSWGSIEYNAGVLKENLLHILDETNCGKVNLIAHSKGGLEARYLISTLGMAGHVASLTTIATPHHGSKSMDLFMGIPAWLFHVAAFFTNNAFRMLGDRKPDFFTASRQFSTAHAKAFNEQNPDAPSVYYQSYAAVMKNPFSDLIMFWPNLCVGLIEGENDGLVTPDSASWANFRGVLRGNTARGISHPDEVDIRRMNFPKKENGDGVTDIRDIYIALVSELKGMGF